MGENINICWSPDGKYVGVGNKEDLISFIDMRQLKIIKDITNDGEANEIGWNLHGTHFFITTGLGTIRILDWPTLNLVHTMNAHTGSVYCFEMDPRGRYIAAGSADAIVSLWDTEDFVCVRTFTSLEWPVRSLSFTNDGELLAAGSEDLFIDIVSGFLVWVLIFSRLLLKALINLSQHHVESGQTAHRIPVNAATNTISFHPNKWVLAYAGDDEPGSVLPGSFRILTPSDGRS